MTQDSNLRELTSKDFPAFFEELWGYRPFDWQTRLLERVRGAGWPSTLDLPTGSGKTATLDIAVFALALDAFVPAESRRQSRRIALVVDRRVVVDQAYDRAVQMAQKLDHAGDGVLADVALALRRLSGDPKGLPVLPAILRGGMPREMEWARTPSQPVVLVSTVDQVGSRLLFRGYGVSDGMKPVHAGLLGRDTLYLLDEVHLARPFEETLGAIARWYAGSDTSAERLPRPLAFVRMSATVAGDPDESFFGLEAVDREHEKLRDRLGASKEALLLQVNTPRDAMKAGVAIAKAAVREVERLSKGPPRAIAVIVNRVKTAGQIAALARASLGNDWSVRLLTGRMRPLDRVERQAGLLERVRAGRTRADADERILLVSTQAMEAGADFDFDALVTECASLDALRQRFGRLDRLGELKESRAVVLAGSGSVDDKADPDPIYGEALRNTWRWLNEVSELSQEHDARIVDFGIDALGEKLAAAGMKAVSALLAPRAVAPVLVPSHLDRWVQTSPAPSADPEIAPFLHGMGRHAAEVQIVWRADIDQELLNETALPFIRSALETVRPSALEALSVPLWAATRWLAAVAARRGRAESPELLATAVSLTDVEGGADPDEAESERIAPAALWRARDSAIAREPDDIRPGDTLVVPSSYGGMDLTFDCWDPEATDPVRDRGDEAQLLHRGKAVIRWNAGAVGAWGSALSGSLREGPKLGADDVEERGPRAEREAFQEWRRAVLADPAAPPWARVALGALARGEAVSRVDLPASREESEEQGATGGAWRVTLRLKRLPAGELRPLLDLPSVREMSIAGILPAEAATEDDEGSFLGEAVPLTRHLEGVRELAREFARALDLPRPIADDVVFAAWLHDLGKADARFQLLLHGGDPVREAAAAELLAKSAVPAADRAARERARARSRYPKGTRHEAMSVALIEHEEKLRVRAHDWDLVLHLVASHHGWCRPFAPPVLDPEPLSVRVQFDGLELTAMSDHELSRVDSGIAERFWRLVRRYGWWGLAWLEAIVRLADHRESEREAMTEEHHA